MYRFASSGLITPPCGVPRVFCLPPVIRRFPLSSFSSTGNFEPHLDQTQHIPIYDSPSDTLYQFAVWDGVEVLRQISVHYIRVAAAQKLMYFLDRILRAPFRSITIGI